MAHTDTITCTLVTSAGLEAVLQEMRAASLQERINKRAYELALERILELEAENAALRQALGK